MTGAAAGRGRPRDAGRDREHLEATQELLVEVGLRPAVHGRGGQFVGSDARRDAVIAGLLTAMAHDDHLREAVSAAIGSPRYAEFAAVIRQAVDRGAVAPTATSP